MENRVENIIDVLACDVGYFSVKAAYRVRGSIEAFNFPSIVSRSTRDTLRSTAEFFGRNDGRLEVSAGGTTYAVDTSRSALPSSTAVRTEVDNFPQTEAYTALVLACLKKIRSSRIRCLVLGLPIHTMHKHTDYLKSYFSAVHQLGELGRCVVEKVVVLPQPLGTFAFLRSQGLISGERHTSTCIVDVGWHTTDAIVIDPAGTPDLERSIGLSGGAARVVREVARLTSEKTGSRMDNLDRVDHALRNGERLHVSGNYVDLDPHLCTALKDTQQIADAVLTAIRTSEDLKVYVTGGGARFYLDALSGSMGFAVKLVDRSQMANVLGFLMAAEVTLRAQGAR